MSKNTGCYACRFYSGGGKSRIAIKHTCTPEEKERFKENKEKYFVKCHCPCHKEGGENIKHVSPCCNNGVIYLTI